MANMKLDAYDFSWQPDSWTIPKHEKYYGKVLTYESAGYFSFGTSIIGKEIILSWDFMSIAQFNQLNQLCLDDESHLWEPDNGYIYLVELLKLEGEFFEVVDMNSSYRRNVQLTMMIMSETLLS